MSIQRRAILIFICATGMMLHGAGVALGENSPQIAIDNALCRATDDLGRRLPGWEDTGDPKPNRWVGMFYWQWHGKMAETPDYDITEYLKTHPKFIDWQAFPPGAPAHPTWYWAQPLFGYYLSTDPWVIRKHLMMIADAGVDFLFLDYTNADLYNTELAAFINVAEDLKAKGVHVPKITFFLNYEPDWKVEALYKTWYKPGKYDDMWFMWQGKPLIMSPTLQDAKRLKEPALLPEIQRFFTFRPTWAFHSAETERTKWRFLDVHPQRPAFGPDGNIEQMVVSKSTGGPIWTSMQIGGVSCVPGFEPTYNDQFQSPDNAKGLFFQQQWDVARKVGAPILLITGWNEWTASVWETPDVVMQGRTTSKGQGHIVDEFNMDFDRDVEPMKGGYNDNYYMQMIGNIRRYKGMEAPEHPSSPKTLAIDGDFKAWTDVRPVFRHPIGAVANRDFDGCLKGTHYTNTSDRNNIAAAQVARDDSMLYFHVQTAAPLTSSTGKNWMMLLIDIDANAATGWHGYDFLVNRTRSHTLIGHGADEGPDVASVERNVGGAWKWEKLGGVNIRWADNQLELAIPRLVLGINPSSGPLKFEFKWVDNIPDAPDIMDFYSQGDAAPNGRFNFRFDETQRPVSASDPTGSSSPPPPRPTTTP